MTILDCEKIIGRPVDRILREDATDVYFVTKDGEIMSAEVKQDG